jgi:hypothetical protein
MRRHDPGPDSSEVTKSPQVQTMPLAFGPAACRSKPALMSRRRAMVLDSGVDDRANEAVAVPSTRARDRA